MPTNQAGVYLILHKESGTCYIGSAGQKIYLRWGQHRYALRKGIHRNSHLQNAWNKYGERSFAWLVLENVEPEKVLECEQYWTDLYRLRGIRLYNTRDRVASQLGMHHSDATKQLLSQKLKGRAVSAETRQKISLIHKGRPHPWSIKAFAKHWPTLVSPEGEPHTIYNLTQFCNERGLDVSAMRKVALGQRPVHNGWRLLKDGEQPTPYIAKVHDSGISHTITAPDGTIYENVTNLESFGREHGVLPGGLRHVAKGNYRHYRGWLVSRQDYEPKTTDKRLHRDWPTLRAPDSSIHTPDNLGQLCKQHGLDKGALQRVANGKQKTHLGWTLAYR